MKEGNYVLNTHRIVGPYNAYCKSKNVKRADKLDRFEIERVVPAIFKEIGLQLIERKGGVLIKKFGYFCVFISKGHFYHRWGKSDLQLRYTPERGGERIRTVFIPNAYDTDLMLWSMDSTFTAPVYDTIKKNVQSGREYRIYPSTLRRLLNRPLEERIWRPIKQEDNGGE